MPHTPNANRAFIGMQMQLGAGLSLGSEVAAAQGRYQSALLAVDAARLELSISKPRRVHAIWKTSPYRPRRCWLPIPANICRADAPGWT